MSTILGLDPGDRYCGIVELDHKGNIIANSTHEPRYAIQYLKAWCGVAALDVGNFMIIEEFGLYPGKMKFKAHDTLLIVETIGVAKYLADQHRIPYRMVRPADATTFFKGRVEPKLGTKHELSAWRVAEWWRLFKLEDSNANNSTDSIDDTSDDTDSDRHDNTEAGVDGDL